MNVIENINDKWFNGNSNSAFMQCIDQGRTGPKIRLSGLLQYARQAVVVNKKLTDFELNTFADNVSLSNDVFDTVPSAYHAILARLAIQTYKYGGVRLNENSIQYDNYGRRVVLDTTINLDIMNDCYGTYCLLVNNKPFIVYEVNNNTEMLILFVYTPFLTAVERISNLIIDQLLINYC